MANSNQGYAKEMIERYSADNASMPLDTKLEDYIKAGREAKGLSQRELGRKIGISATQISKIEMGHARPNRSTLRKLSAHLGLNYRDMLLMGGFSDVRARNVYFDKSGNEIDVGAILDSIYKVDSSLLSELAHFDEIGTAENTAALRLLIRGMRKEVTAATPGQRMGHGDEDASAGYGPAFPAFIVGSLRQHIISLFKPLDDGITEDTSDDRVVFVPEDAQES